ncbi:collagen alpha-1(I) chain-like [Canis lupus dingo]|uniref:collagen alpha-1(I) chain-like n=1 Tax=Canis lupus dingo TaxID=286419 RepID=UPI000DC6C569|nr:collagen alpha-1(I) chain-like [Canis lupus dingo]XP_038292056.1 collagen alpha-1(I) chain-like isoform X1 [Canis lupus familiaris]
MKPREASPGCWRPVSDAALAPTPPGAPGPLHEQHLPGPRVSTGGELQGLRSSQAGGEEFVQTRRGGQREFVLAPGGARGCAGPGPPRPQPGAASASPGPPRRDHGGGKRKLGGRAAARGPLRLRAAGLPLAAAPGNRAGGGGPCAPVCAPVSASVCACPGASGTGSPGALLLPAAAVRSRGPSRAAAARHPQALPTSPTGLSARVCPRGRGAHGGAGGGGRTSVTHTTHFIPANKQAPRAHSQAVRVASTPTPCAPAAGLGLPNVALPPAASGAREGLVTEPGSVPSPAVPRVLSTVCGPAARPVTSGVAAVPGRASIAGLQAHSRRRVRARAGEDGGTPGWGRRPRSLSNGEGTPTPGGPAPSARWTEKAPQAERTPRAPAEPRAQCPRRPPRTASRERDQRGLRGRTGLGPWAGAPSSSRGRERAPGERGSGEGAPEGTGDGGHRVSGGPGEGAPGQRGPRGGRARSAGAPGRARPRAPGREATWSAGSLGRAHPVSGVSGEGAPESTGEGGHLVSGVPGEGASGQRGLRGGRTPRAPGREATRSAGAPGRAHPVSGVSGEGAPREHRGERPPGQRGPWGGRIRSAGSPGRAHPESTGEGGHPVSGGPGEGAPGQRGPRGGRARSAGALGRARPRAPGGKPHTISGVPGEGAPREHRGRRPPWVSGVPGESTRDGGHPGSAGSPGRVHPVSGVPGEGASREGTPTVGDKPGNCGQGAPHPAGPSGWLRGGAPGEPRAGTPWCAVRPPVFPSRVAPGGPCELLRSC